MKRLLTMALVTALLVSYAGTAFAETVVLTPNNADARQIVQTRKFVKNTMMANYKEIKKEIEAGDIAGVITNAQSLAALSALLPLAYEKTYPEGYGSGYNHKGGSYSGFVHVAQETVDRAEALAAIAQNNNPEEVRAFATEVLDSCQNCHATYKVGGTRRGTKAGKALRQ